MAWWLDPKQVVPDKQFIRMQIFAGMPALYVFLDSALAALPKSMLGFYSNGRRYKGTPTLCSKMLKRPRRCKLIDHGLHTPEARRDILGTSSARWRMMTQLSRMWRWLHGFPRGLVSLSDFQTTPASTVGPIKLHAFQGKPMCRPKWRQMWTCHR